MAAASTQPEVQIPQHAVSPASRAHRWTDLGLVLLVAFAISILGSIFRAFHPGPLNYSNTRLVFGMVDEARSSLGLESVFPDAFAGPICLRPWV